MSRREDPESLRLGVSRKFHQTCAVLGAFPASGSMPNLGTDDEAVSSSNESQDVFFDDEGVELGNHEVARALVADSSYTLGPGY